jgi:hypothetical protein
MNKATNDILNEFDIVFEKRKNDILHSKDRLNIKGVIYYVSESGDDKNDGLSPKTPWKSLNKVSDANLNSGDGVLFKRDDLFRGCIKVKEGVTYGAYGDGEKPKLYAGNADLADDTKWALMDPDCNIWKYTEKQLDPGTLVFNEGEKCAYKLIPSYLGGKFVVRDNPEKNFIMCREMKNNLDMYWEFDEKLTTSHPHPVTGEDFPVPDVDGAMGYIYLRCDNGNPGEVFSSIENVARSHMFYVGDKKDVTIDNLCIKYVGMHGISAGMFAQNLTVTNCEFGWIGGTIQHYFGLDPNYPEGGRGTVTRFGNAIEVYGGCKNYTASDNYIYEVYDAGITHQVTTNTKLTMENIRYTGNLIENCVYGIEYFLDQIDGERESYMDDVVMDNNYIRNSGFGWGQQRHNKHTPAAIKGWSYVNTASNYSITNNIFDKCAFRLLHLVALENTSLPYMDGNTYIQYLGGKIGQFGENKIKEPENLDFDTGVEDKIQNIFGDKNAKIYYIEEK